MSEARGKKVPGDAEKHFFAIKIGRSWPGEESHNVWLTSEGSEVAEEGEMVGSFDKKGVHISSVDAYRFRETAYVMDELWWEIRGVGGR